MTRTVPPEHDAFTRRFTGEVVGPGEPEYDRARSVWNAAV